MVRYILCVQDQALMATAGQHLKHLVSTLTVHIDDGATVTGDRLAGVSGCGHNDIVAECDGVASADRAAGIEPILTQHQRVQRLELCRCDAGAGTARTSRLFRSESDGQHVTEHWIRM
jgi:hypothetical protein